MGKKEKEVVEQPIKKEMNGFLFVLSHTTTHKGHIEVYEKRLDVQGQFYYSSCRAYYEDCTHLMYSNGEDFKIVKSLVFGNG